MSIESYEKIKKFFDTINFICGIILNSVVFIK